MSPDVIAVSVISDYQLLLSYENGEQRRFDMKYYLTKKPFNRLLKDNLFFSVHVAYGTVAWTEHIDMSPDTLYLRSVPVEK
jgi:hypothetical protein